MVKKYLENLQSGFLEEKVTLEKEISDLQIHLKENVEFIRLLEENNDTAYASFSPREVNPKNKVKIEELNTEKKKMEKQLEQLQEQYAECIAKLQELSEVIHSLQPSAAEQEASVAEDREKYRLTILETQENERQRISRELHDSTVQNLTSMVHKVELCSKLVEMDPIRCKLELVTLGKTLREIINDTRQMIYNLRPMSFDDIGLEVTIERALDKLETNEAKKVDFSVVGESYKIKPVIGITLLRIVQEACSNAIKHAEAAYIKVRLQYEPNEIQLTIEDDGIGFDVEHTAALSKKDNSGFGLSMMKERIYLLSGNINIESKINCGTKIYVNVPIVEANKEDNKDGC